VPEARHACSRHFILMDYWLREAHGCEKLAWINHNKLIHKKCLTC
jgi:hypothetical protein